MLWDPNNVPAGQDPDGMAYYPDPSGSYECSSAYCTARDCAPLAPPSSPSTPPFAPPLEEDPCFPSWAIVTLANGQPSRVDALKEGDEIVAADADGVLTTDTVSLLSFAKPEAQAVTFLTVVTDSANLSLTLDHRLPVGAVCCSILKKAKDIIVGDTIWEVKAGIAVATAVSSVGKVQAKGLHSPVLTHGGFPVVDGVVTSFDSIEKVTLAKYGLAPLLAVCKATGRCDKIRDSFRTPDNQYIA